MARGADAAVRVAKVAARAATAARVAATEAEVAATAAGAVVTVEAVVVVVMGMAEAANRVMIQQNWTNSTRFHSVQTPRAATTRPTQPQTLATCVRMHTAFT